MVESIKEGANVGERWVQFSSQSNFERIVCLLDLECQRSVGEVTLTLRCIYVLWMVKSLGSSKMSDDKFQILQDAVRYCLLFSDIVYYSQIISDITR